MFQRGPVEDPNSPGRPASSPRRWSRPSIEEVGRFTDHGGNHLWGVQLTNKFVNARRVVAFSDRDYGQYLAS
jgi:hypothetical protein